MPLSDAATIALARDLYPDVTTAVASDAYLTAWLPTARAQVGADAWELQYDTGVAMLLAAKGQSRAGGGSTGFATSVATHAMSVSYQGVVQPDAPVSDQVLAGTPAGRDFLAIRNSLPAYVLPIVVCL